MKKTTSTPHTPRNSTRRKALPAPHQAVLALSPLNHAPGTPQRYADEQEIEAIQHSMDAVANSVLNDAQREVITGVIPPHAIKYREGGGGALYPYLKHGFVTLKLNQAFGFDWDFDLLPVFNGNVYELTPSDVANMPTKNATVMVFGRLVVRVRGIGENGMPVLITTITKTGFGSVEWRKKQELGDALKGAASDARKVCAAQIGLGLQLYWDDEAQQSDYEDRKRKTEQLAKEMSSPTPALPPSNGVAILLRAQSEYGLAVGAVLGLLGLQSPLELSVITDQARCAELWTKITNAHNTAQSGAPNEGTDVTANN